MPRDPDSTSAAPLDGRARRGVRNRQRIAEALFELVEEGVLVPTADQVAERAEVSTRSVFRHYEDMDGLYAEINERVQRELVPQDPGPPIACADDSLEQRIRGVVRLRAGVFERIGPFKRAGETQRWRSKFLQEEHAQMVRHLRKMLRVALPEVEALGDTAEVVDLMLSFEGWTRLRIDQGLPRQMAEAALIDAVRRLLAST